MVVAWVIGTELRRDLRQQQPGAGHASSESHDDGQDQDIHAGVESDDQEQASDQEQDRSDGVRRDRIEDRRNSMRGGIACDRTPFVGPPRVREWWM
jgi:hypothetical protein